MIGSPSNLFGNLFNKYKSKPIAKLPIKKTEYEEWKDLVKEGVDDKIVKTVSSGTYMISGSTLSVGGGSVAVW